MEMQPGWLDDSCQLDLWEGELARQHHGDEEFTPIITDLRVWRRENWLNFKAIAEDELWYSDEGIKDSTDDSAHDRPPEGAAAKVHVDWYIRQLGDSDKERLGALRSQSATKHVEELNRLTGKHQGSYRVENTSEYKILRRRKAELAASATGG